MTTEITVSNLTQLKSALSSAKGGETIKLKDGYYGSLSVTKDFASTVKIEAINPQRVTFEDIDVRGGSYVHFDGFVVKDQPSVTNDANHVTFSNNVLKNGLYFRHAEDIVVHNNDIGNSYNVLTLNDVHNFEITENTLHDARSDILRITGDSKFGLVENNTFTDIGAVRPDHPDFIQMFGTSNGNPTDIILRGNHLHDDPKTGDVYGQGFFLSDPTHGGYKNILIENNLINIGSPNSIYINGGQENVVVRDNTLLPWPGDGGAIIRVVDKSGLDNRGTDVYNNIAKVVLVEPKSKAEEGGNYLYGRNADISKLFNGDGDKWEDYIPVSGSPVDLSTGLGASARILELLGEGPANDTPPPPPEKPEETVEDESDSAPVIVDGNDAPEDSKPSPVEPETPPEWLNSADLENNDLIAHSMTGSTRFNGDTADVIEIAHNDGLALDAATISLIFNTNTLIGKQGLISKDAAYYSGGGNHFSAYLENDVLIVRFQNGSQDEIIRIPDIKVATDYDLHLSLGGGKVGAWLNGQQVHAANFTTDWSDNVEYLQIGAIGWSSKTGESGFNDVFNGTISHALVVEGSYSPTGLTEMLVAGGSKPPAPSEVETPTQWADLADLADNPLVAFSMVGDYQFNRRAEDVVEVAHNADLALAAATIAMTFNADTVAGKQGLISKDAAYYDGGGNHFISYIEDGVLVVRFQDGSQDEIARIPNIEANTDYTLQISFGGGQVSIWLNDEEVHSAAFTTDWTDNVEYLQVGARGWASKSGEAGFRDVFGGTVSDVIVVEGNYSPVELNKVLVEGDVETTPTDSYPGMSAIFEQVDEISFDGNISSALNLGHKDEYEIDEGTIAFTFNADDLSGRQGLISKDATGYSGGGHHVSAMLNSNKFYIRFQDDDSDATFVFNNVKAGQDYDVQTWFGDGVVGLAINGEVIGVKEFDFDLNQNAQNLQFGGLGWSSADGSDAVTNAFDGTMSDLLILDTAVSLTTDDLFS